MSYVLWNTTHYSLPFFMAPQPIQKNISHSLLIHERGWYSKIHLRVQKVSRSNFNSPHFSFLSKYLYLIHLVYSLHPLHLVKPLRLVKPLIVASLIVLNIHGDQLEKHLVHLFLHSYIVYFLTYCFLDTKPQTTGERNKYSPLQSPYAPYPIPAWSAALQAVDQSPSNLVEASKTSQIYGHYTFPDPGLFIHPSTAGKYIGSWLRVREIWFMRLTREPSLALSSQSWRTFLSIDNAAQGKQDTKAALRRQVTLDTILPSSDMYPGVKRQSGLTEPITWRGREYSSGVLPPENVVREILWELYEINFIHELQSLDRRACCDLDLSSVTELFDRQIEISQCFPTNSFQPVSIPSENLGLADDDFDKRFRYITALVFVMKRWKGEKPDMLTGDLFDLQLSPDGAKEMEKVVAKYYCQQFFNYFGRAAQVPHRLFATSRS
jgi:hypothetical protein